MARISKKTKLIEQLGGCDAGVQYYFDLLEEILNHVSSPEPALAYCFQRIESAQRVSLYVLLMRIYRTDLQLTWKLIDDLDLTRKNFPQFYCEITGKTFDPALTESLKGAMKVRDRITHGKSANRTAVLDAIGDCIRYASALNAKIKADAGFAPFGSLKGVTSSKRPQLSKDISRLLIKGLGLGEPKSE